MFTDYRKRTYSPGDLALWIFILAELLVFAVFFSAYAFTSASHVELFNLYQQILHRDPALKPERTQVLQG